MRLLRFNSKMMSSSHDLALISHAQPDIQGTGSESDASSKGVAKLLKNSLPYLVSVHCIAHRCALVLSNAGEDFDELLKIDVVLRSVYKLFHKSAKEQSLWESFARSHKVKALKFPCFNKTRWSSRVHCICVLLTNLPVLILYLQSRPRWKKGQKVLDMLTSVDTVLTLVVLHDILTITNRLVAQFQTKGIMCYRIYEAVSACKADLKQLVQDDDIVMSEGRVRFKGQLHEGNRWQPHGDAGPTITLSGTVNMFTEEFFAKLVRYILHELTLRFSDCRLVNSFKIFAPISYSGMDRSKLDAYGQRDLHHLLIHYCGKELGSNKLFDISKLPNGPQEVYDEFARLKRRMHALVNIEGCSTDFSLVWSKLSKDAVSFPSVLMLAQACCTIPSHTCDVERGFSVHRTIKHRLTSRLRLPTVDSLMRVKLSDTAFDEISFDKCVTIGKQGQDTLASVLTPVLSSFFDAFGFGSEETLAVSAEGDTYDDGCVIPVVSESEEDSEYESENDSENGYDGLDNCYEYTTVDKALLDGL